MPFLAALISSALTLQAARDLADQRNAGLKAAQAAARAARAGVSAAGQLANPTFTASYGADDPGLQAGLEVKLPVFGQRGAAVQTAEAHARAVEAQASAERARLHAGVRRSFASAWAAEEQASLAAEAAGLAAELARSAGERFRTGGIPELEVLQAQLARDRAEHDLEDRRAEAEAQRRELEAILGGPVEALTPPPTATVPADAELLQRLGAHPEIQALRLDEEAALGRAHEERLAVLPLPSVAVTALRFTEPDVYFGLRAGVAFDLPLLSWNRGRVEEQVATAAAARAQADAARARLEGQVRAARARWAAAASRAEFYGGPFLGSARRVLDMARAGYAIGRTALLAVLQAQAEFSSARSRAVDAALEAQRALSDLEEAAGADL